MVKRQTGQVLKTHRIDGKTGIASHPILVLKNTLMGIFIMTGLIWSFPLFAGNITVEVDRNPVNLNESFQIIFSTSTDPDDDPDFSPLEQDFDIINQGRSSNITMSNGSYSKTINWTLTVIPRKEGNINIPVINFGQDRSLPTLIIVNSNQPETADEAGQDLFLQVDATPRSPYVQGQVIYTLRFYRKVNIAQASLTEPELKDAIIEKLGEDKNYNTQVNGENYVVTERNYAIFPQKSGGMKIKPLVLSAQVVAKNRSRFNGFFNTQPTKVQRVTSNSIELDVQPVPDAFKSRHWLPAEQLHLEQDWSGNTKTVKVGEPLTRTLKLIVKGAAVSQLPELFPNKSDIRSEGNGELKNYPDQPVLKEQKKNDGIVSMREEKVALIPSQPGIYHLPEIEIPWWNTVTQKVEVARISAQTITAIAVSTVPTTPAAIDTTSVIINNKVEQPLPLKNNIWLWISIFLAIGWSATIIYFKTKTREPEETSDAIGSKHEKSHQALKKACRMNDAAAAKNALIQWGREQFQESSLGRIAEHCDEELQTAIQELSDFLYSTGNEQWSGGEKLIKAFQRKMKSPKTSHEDTFLEPLHKI